MKSIENVDWARIECGLDAQGWAVAERLHGPDGCKALAQLYGEDGRFRSTVTMARHGFGRGESRYFPYPLPELVGDLRWEARRVGKQCVSTCCSRWSTYRYKNKHKK